MRADGVGQGLPASARKVVSRGSPPLTRQCTRMSASRLAFRGTRPALQIVSSGQGQQVAMERPWLGDAAPEMEAHNPGRFGVERGHLRCD